MRNDKPTCFKLLVQAIFCALALALARAGRSKPANMAMMAITTNSSMSVKAPILCLLKTRFIIVSVFFGLTVSILLIKAIRVSTQFLRES